MQVTAGITDHAIISLLIIKSLYDTKNQNADEIRRSITKEGVDGVVATRSLDSMIRSRSHFDRSTSSKGVVYSLKKDAARDFKNSGLLAIMNDTKKIVLETKATDEEIITLLSNVSDGGVAATLNVAMMETIKELARGVRFANGISNVPAVTTVKAAVQSTASGGSAMRLAMVNAKRLPATTPRSSHDQFEKPAVEEKVKTTTVSLEHVFDPNVDTIEVAIWKAMADGKQYSVAELQVLLADAKVFAPKSISAKLTVLRRNRQIVRAVNRHGTMIMYELIPGYPMPAHSGRTEPKAPFTKKVPNRAPNPKDDPTVPPNSLMPKITEGVIQKETNILKEEPEMKKVNPPVTVKVDDSILEVSIKVRGIEMKLSELKAIVGVFDSVYNVRDEKHDEPNKIVAVKYEVGDVVYTLADARALVLAYKNHFE